MKKISLKKLPGIKRTGFGIGTTCVCNIFPCGSWTWYPGDVIGKRTNFTMGLANGLYTLTTNFSEFSENSCEIKAGNTVENQNF